MADLAFSAELDAAKFHRELDRMDARTRESERTFNRFEESLGSIMKLATGFKAVQFASSSLDEWARQHDQAAAAVKAHSDAWAGLKADIGGDIIGLDPGPGGIEGGRSARNAIADTLADIVSGETALKKWMREKGGGFGKGFDDAWNETSDLFGFTAESSASETRAAQKAEAASQRQIDREKRMMHERYRVLNQLETDLAQQAESPAHVEMLRHERRQREIRQNPNLPADDRARAQQLEEEYHRRELSRIDEKQRRQQQERIDKRVDRFDDLAGEAERARVEASMIEAKGIELEIERYRLQMNERIRDVQKDQLLTQEEKNGLVGEFETARDQGSLAMQRKFEREEAARRKYTVLELAGVADSATRRQVIGVGPGSAERTGEAADRTAKATEKTSDGVTELGDVVREGIDRFIREGSTARYGR